MNGRTFGVVSSPTIRGEVRAEVALTISRTHIACLRVKEMTEILRCDLISLGDVILTLFFGTAGDAKITIGIVKGVTDTFVVVGREIT